MRFEGDTVVHRDRHSTRYDTGSEGRTGGQWRWSEEGP